MMMSSVRLVTILAKAAPMITATARSRTLPLAMNARKSFSIATPFQCSAPDNRPLIAVFQQQHRCIACLRQHLERERPWLYLSPNHRWEGQMNIFRSLGLLAPLAALS